MKKPGGRGGFGGGVPAGGGEDRDDGGYCLRSPWADGGGPASAIQAVAALVATAVVVEHGVLYSDGGAEPQVGAGERGLGLDGGEARWDGSWIQNPLRTSPCGCTHAFWVHKLVHTILRGRFKNCIFISSH